MKRFKDPNDVGPTMCLAYGNDGSINNYGYPSPEDIPAEPQPCPRSVNGAACGALVVMRAINVNGLRHVANAQLAPGQRCPSASHQDSENIMSALREVF